MSQVSKRLREFYALAEKRYVHFTPVQRVVLLCSGIGLVLWIAWSTAVVPVVLWKNQQQQRYVAEHSLYEWLKLQTPKLAELRSKTTTENTQTLVSLITGSAQGQGIAVSQYNPIDENALRLNIDAVNFEALMKWITSLSTQHPELRISSLRVYQAEKPGTVNIALQIKR